jgi:hypothetical protein
MKLIQDSYMDSLIPQIRKRAERLIRDASEVDMEDMELQLRFWFSKKYSIPMFSDVLDNYTLPQMLLEFYLHEEAGKDVTEKTEEVIKESRDDLADMIAKEFSEDEKAFMDDVFGKEDQSWNFSEESGGFK